MCGVAGILVPPHDEGTRRLGAIHAMTATLRHRGPDAEGHMIDREAGIALGHRRLAIVDLSQTGSQPMSSGSGELVIAYNGEIYNFLELRTELTARGWRFVGRSDTEVMLAAFETWGLESALGRFVGMFAFALWDKRRRVLHLGRDRLGKKPLYIAVSNRVLLFASELKALRAFPGFAPAIDRDALRLVLRYGWVPDDCCVFEGVFKLPPGTLLSVEPSRLMATDAQALRGAARPWWTLAQVAAEGQASPLRGNDADLEDMLDELLRRAVRERLVADVPIGAFLSGGIDSSMVVAQMQAASSRPVRTFTVGFTEPGYSEAREAAAIAHRLGTEHSELHFTAAEAATVIPDLPTIWDEPFAAESQIATFLMARLARTAVTVALSGDGGDECFGGYARHFATGPLRLALSTPRPLRRALLAALRRTRPELLVAVLRGMPAIGTRTRITAESLVKLGEILEAERESDLYLRLASIGGSACPHVLAQGPELPDFVSRQIYRDMCFYLPGNVLVKLDRASMACGLEARSPLLDHRLVEFAWRLPLTAKVRDGQGKWLLRRALRRYLPPSLFERPKSGFNVPIGRWLRGPLRAWADDLLAGSRLREQGLLDPTRTLALWREHLSGSADRGCELWAILVVAGWLEAQRAACPAEETPPTTGSVPPIAVPA